MKRSHKIQTGEEASESDHLQAAEAAAGSASQDDIGQSRPGKRARKNKVTLPQAHAQQGLPSQPHVVGQESVSAGSADMQQHHQHVEVAAAPSEFVPG